ncbi:hypothetical protein [Nocardia sp. NPDC050406]|uniref:hypothetical protein n=1 Tax=Nocardia sp. NPDC050406 TaxID=3364318 RepID=UPI003799B3F1
MDPAQSVRYHLFVQIADDCLDIGDWVVLVVTGASLPRVGDTLGFAGAEPISMEVVRVDHLMYDDTCEPPHRATHVLANALPYCWPTVRKLHDELELKRWASRYTMLELDC